MEKQQIFHEKFGRILLLIVALVSVGQLTNTIYVPALTLIASSIHVHPELVESLIGCYLLTYGVSQFVYGPLSDIYGRRPTVIVGLIIFAFGCILAAIANHFWLLLVGCLIQGLGTGVCGVMARTVMRDCYTDHKLQKANSYVSAALILAPLIAPLIGGALSVYFSWRADFIFLLVFGTVILGIEYYLFPETNLYIGKKYQQRDRIITAYQHVLTHKAFWGYALTLIATLSGLAVFEASAGVLFTKVLHFQVKNVSLLFVLPIPGYLLGSYLAAYWAEHSTLNQLMTLGIFIVFLATLLLCIFAFSLWINIYAILIPITVYFFGAGILFPTATTGALNTLGEYAGTAGAVLGGTQNIGAALLTFAFSSIPQTTQRPLALALIASTLVLLITYLVFIHKQEGSV